MSLVDTSKKVPPFWILAPVSRQIYFGAILDVECTALLSGSPGRNCLQFGVRNVLLKAPPERTLV